MVNKTKHFNSCRYVCSAGYVGQFVMVIKSFQYLSELTIEDEENRKPGRRRRWVASSVPTQINIHTMRQKNLCIF